ncbi:hypothetical protein JNB91_09880 [Rhizobium wenxiniae]|uniref:hypothetical protein n=1 Tax=Rhizobium wenxiniae TaxID=1737357 RepID=UPI001C6DFE86|nr:hypothetical protein [Rhizobium wenxiniae]MBW9088151.1 hypothetical protein [Rhizobium wenxiniae]
MTENDSESAQAKTQSQKIRSLIRLLASSVMAALMMSLIAGSASDLLYRFWKPEQVAVWQLSDIDHKAILDRLEKSSADAATLKEMVADNPKAVQLVETLKADISATKELLRSLPYVERSASLDLVPDVFSPAHAQQVAQTAPAEDHSLNMFLYIILGLVSFVLVVFCLMYVFSTDKTKTAFAEKTITTIIGFALGMLTGSNTGKLR